MSKFSNKYRERIDSIREADEKITKKKKMKTALEQRDEMLKKLEKSKFNK